jgi:hypothetical protein
VAAEKLGKVFRTFAQAQSSLFPGELLRAYYFIWPLAHIRAYADMQTCILSDRFFPDDELRQSAKPEQGSVSGQCTKFRSNPLVPSASQNPKGWRGAASTSSCPMPFSAT